MDRHKRTCPSLRWVGGMDDEQILCEARETRGKSEI